MDFTCNTGISVVIPTFNRVSFLYPTLICLCNQKTDFNYEIIIIDSGNDETETIIKNFTKQIKVPVVYKKIKRCSNRALLRNKGVELAKYDLLLFIDNDMLVPPEYLQEHFNAHKNQDKLIICGRRKTLTDFNLNQLGNDFLINSFKRLDELPWYDDERLTQNLGFETWRYVYTHSLSVKKAFFNQVGGFTNAFGNVWGGEDIELSYKLFKKGASFLFMKEPAIYHQGHFSQSTKEQHASDSAARLFARLHNSYNTELFIAFPSVSVADSYENSVLRIKKYNETVKQSVPSKEVFKQFDLILGYVTNAAEENNVNPKLRLGVFLPQNEKSLRKILIASSIFDFPKDVQDCIFSEAYRVTDGIFFEKEADSTSILEIVIRSGFIGRVIEQGGYKKIEITGYKGDGAVHFLLPDLLIPQKRFVFLNFAGLLLEQNKRVILRDKRNAEFIQNEDFALDKELASKLNKCFRLKYGSIPVLYVTPYSNTADDKVYLFPNIPGNFIVQDEDIFIEEKLKLPAKYSRSTILNSKIFSLMSYFMAEKEVKAVLSACEKGKSQTGNFVVFMENGYSEDSIAEVLETFAEYSKNNKSAYLILKMPEYKLQLQNAYPFHNESSKCMKVLDQKRKIELDRLQLNKKLEELGLADKVQIVEKNLSFRDVVKLIMKSEAVIEVSKTKFGGPEVYAGLLVGKKVIISEHFIIPSELKPYFVTVSSEKCSAAESLGLPLMSSNINYSLFNISKKGLLEALSIESKTPIVSEKTKEELDGRFKQVLNYFS